MVSPSSGGSPSHAPDDRRGSADGKRTKERKRYSNLDWLTKNFCLYNIHTLVALHVYLRKKGA